MMNVHPQRWNDRFGPWMNVRVIKSLIFIIWVVAITALSVMPYSKNGVAFLKLTESGMVLHFAGYFVASFLFYWAFRKDTLFSILFSCFSIFLFSVFLEIIQRYLPYRTFNPKDIIANALGIFSFVVIWLIYLARSSHLRNKASHFPSYD
jgi:glycopeptide antibiotics resistance protein